MMKITDLSFIILNRSTCTISGWLNTFWPHCMFCCLEKVLVDFELDVW